MSHLAGTLWAVTTCPACRQPSASAPCAACVARMRPPPDEPPPAGLDWCRAVAVYDGAAQAAITALKFRDGRRSASWMADALAVLAADAPGPIDVITWVPAAPGRRRGFDQGAVLARALARRLRVPARRLLRRRAGPPQTGRDQRGRAAGPVLESRPRPPARVLVVDDVWTTGASLTAAAMALRGAGARAVSGLTVGRTLLKPPLSVAEGERDAQQPPLQPRSPRPPAPGPGRVVRAP
jgi:predicted amidophosphoribosyltransferase